MRQRCDVAGVSWLVLGRFYSGQNDTGVGASAHHCAGVDSIGPEVLGVGRRCRAPIREHGILVRWHNARHESVVVKLPSSWDTSVDDDHALAGAQCEQDAAECCFIHGPILPKVEDSGRLEFPHPGQGRIERGCERV